MENKRRITVSIDTSGIREAYVKLMDEEGLVIRECRMEGKSQTILPVFEKVLSEAKITMDDIIGITVNCGPGSFTGLRVGVAVAKLLSLLLGIEINGEKSWHPVEILYEKDKFAGNPLQG
jgi:tRNA threonylcarbamoyladenosine biosynthesis protein TsaB